MAKVIGNGTKFAIASTIGSAINMTAITNATEAVATLAAAHGVVVNDILELTSGWELLNGRVARVKAVSTNDVTLELINTSSTANYPAGEGTGTVRKITAWATMTQVQEVAKSGGDQQYVDATSLADKIESQMPTVKAARNMVFTVFDDPALSWRTTVQTAQDGQLNVPARRINAKGQVTYYNGLWSIDQDAGVARNEIDTHTVALAVAVEPTRYA
jgi:hypothetical protein